MNGYFCCLRFFPLSAQIQNENVEGLKELFCNFGEKHVRFYLGWAILHAT